jgi:hypothetical protein
MIMRTAKDITSLSVEGVEYEVRDGLVELPDTLPIATVKNLVEGHGMTVAIPEDASKGVKKGKE